MIEHYNIFLTWHFSADINMCRRPGGGGGWKNGGGGSIGPPGKGLAGGADPALDPPKLKGFRGVNMDVGET